MSARDDTRKALDTEWRKASDVHARVAMWSLLTVRSTLRRMARAGEIERRDATGHPFPTSEYRLKPAESPDGEKR